MSIGATSAPVNEKLNDPSIVKLDLLPVGIAGYLCRVSGTRHRSSSTAQDSTPQRIKKGSERGSKRSLHFIAERKGFNATTL